MWIIFSIQYFHYLLFDICLHLHFMIQAFHEFFLLSSTHNTYYYSLLFTCFNTFFTHKIFPLCSVLCFHVFTIFFYFILFPEKLQKMMYIFLFSIFPHFSSRLLFVTPVVRCIVAHSQNFLLYFCMDKWNKKKQQKSFIHKRKEVARLLG